MRVPRRIKNGYRPGRVLPFLLVASIGFTLPASAYHISGGISQANPAWSSGDWIMDGVVALVVCESDGNDNPSSGDLVDGVEADDRNPSASGPTPGQGGLCTTGRNGVTGLLAPTTRPAVDDWTKLDTCSRTWRQRDSDASKGLTAGETCLYYSVNVPGSTSDTSWTAEVGAYSCRIPRAEPDRNDPFNDDAGPVTGDLALYYQELYVWWSYDGDGTYGDANSGATEDGSTWGADPDQTTAGTHAGLAGGSDWAAAWHGHVGMFIEDTPNVSGSAVASATSPPATHSGGTTGSYGTGTRLGREPINPVSETRGNNCGASPAGTPVGTATTTACAASTSDLCGPVLRAP